MYSSISSSTVNSQQSKVVCCAQHRGATLIELLLYLALLGIVIGAILPLLFAATEERLLQQTIAITEQNGAQIIQNLTRTIRESELILDPAIGDTRSVLALQTSSGATSPVIVGSHSGSIYVARHATIERLSSPQVAVQDFSARNTSTSASRQSVTISFRVSRTIRLQQPYSYARDFSFTITLPPDDLLDGDPCECNTIPPYCDGSDLYRWQVCQNSVCLDASTQLDCP